MTFSEAEKSYRDLKAQHDSGRLTDAAFETEVGKLRMQDAQGRWWQIGVQTGEWYMHDGQKWNKAKPPIAPPPPGAPVSSPEGAGISAARAGTPPRVAAPPKAEPAPKKEGTPALPARLFSSKPIGRNGGGLPPAVLIGIIAAVAIVVVVILVAAVLFIQGQASKDIAKALVSPTPTRGSLVIPTSALPTLPPKPTDAPLPPPTPVITETIPLTTTVAAPTPAAPRATATRRPPTATPAPATSPTPNVPPGVYVMKLETDPLKITIASGENMRVGFKMTLFNNTGSVQTFTKWFVRIYQCPEQCIGDNAYRNSYGESLKIDVNVGTGTVEITTPPHANFGPGRCDYVAMPYYTTKDDQVVPFPKTNGQALYYSFKVCQ